MRFNRLDILRYGALTDRSLVFRPGAGLHLVYGPNEAGKSSILAAISDLLFGFPQRREQDFLHDAASLRIGAELQRQDGDTLAFRRRRGNKNTLLADSDDESALREDALAPYLGTLSRAIFERAFGLDSQRLRTGADEMLKSEGEIGSVLFAAASGLSGLKGLKAGLDTQAEQIFTPRASKDRLFYQVLTRHEAARKQERDSELRASDWQSLNAAIDDLQKSHADLRGKQRALHAKLEHLRQLLSLRPIIVEIEEDEAALAAYADLAEFSAAFADDLQARRAAAKTVEQEFTAAQDILDRQTRELERIEVDDTMAAKATEVTTLFGENGGYKANMKDLPAIRRERDDKARAILEKARALGLGDAAEVLARQPPDAALAESGELIREGRARNELRETLTRSLADERAALADLDRNQTGGTLIDPKPWRDRLTSLEADLKRLETREELEDRHQKASRKLTERAARLVPPVGDEAQIDRLAKTALPSLETLTRYRDALARHEREIVEQRETLANATAELAELDRVLTETEEAGAVPTREAIAAARQARDAGFAELRRLAIEPLGKVDDRLAVLQRVEDLSVRADSLADAALHNAEQVLRQAEQVRRAASLRIEIPPLTDALAVAEAEWQAAQSRYLDLFAGVVTGPGSPGEMIDWVKTLSDILIDRQVVHELTDQIELLSRLEERLRPALAEIAQGIGCGSGELPVLALARAITSRLKELTEHWTNTRAAEGLKRDREERVAKFEGALSDMGLREEAWAKHFAAALPALALPANAGIAAAEAALALWSKLPELRSEHENRERRVLGMQRDADAFADKVKALVDELAPDLQTLPPQAAIAELHTKAQFAQSELMRRAAAQQALNEHQAVVDEKNRASIRAAEALAELTSKLDAETDLGELLLRLRQRDTLTGNLQQSRRRLRESAPGQDETEIRSALEGFDPVKAVTDIDDLKDDEDRLTERVQETYAQLNDKLRERDTLQQGAGAELAAFEKNAAETELNDVARRWLVLRLASAMLGTSLDRHREAHAAPQMQRAGQIFSTLTGGDFNTLLQDYGEDDTPRLMGRRANGNTVAVSGMSEGTRDQLYLALRLAFLEDYAGRNEPVPFIGDDIFQTFDDARTANGLRALAEASAHVQPILFTHHKSVVDTAQNALQDRLDLIEL